MIQPFYSIFNYMPYSGYRPPECKLQVHSYDRSLAVRSSNNPFSNVLDLNNWMQVNVQESIKLGLSRIVSECWVDVQFPLDDFISQHPDWEIIPVFQGGGINYKLVLNKNLAQWRENSSLRTELSTTIRANLREVYEKIGFNYENFSDVADESLQVMGENGLKFSTTVERADLERLVKNPFQWPDMTIDEYVQSDNSNRVFFTIRDQQGEAIAGLLHDNGELTEAHKNTHLKVMTPLLIFAQCFLKERGCTQLYGEVLPHYIYSVVLSGRKICFDCSNSYKNPQQILLNHVPIFPDGFSADQSRGTWGDSMKPHLQSFVVAESQFDLLTPDITKKYMEYYA